MDRRICPQSHLKVASPLPRIESRGVAAVSLWKHKRLFGARPSGRPKTAEERSRRRRKVLLDPRVRTDLIGAGGEIDFLSSFPERWALKRHCVNIHSLTHVDEDEDREEGATGCLPANRVRGRMNA